MDATQVFRALVVGLLGAIALQIAMLPGELRQVRQSPRARAAPPNPYACPAGPRSWVAPPVLHVQRAAVGEIDRTIGAMIGQPVRELEAITVDGQRVRMVLEDADYSSETPRFAQ